MSEGLFERLKDYSDSDFYPFHMPGHKRSPESGHLAEICRYDITEIEGFDNLHQPESVIRDAQKRAAELYHSEETYFLVNGSTAGILSAVSAVARRGSRLIISRNCHKAVYHAAFLNRLKLHYVYPEILGNYGIAGAVRAERVKQVIESILGGEKENAEAASKLIAGVVITSPSYEGIVSDVEEIVRLVHGYGIPLIVDQAHGAHFGLHPSWPDHAVGQGADIVIHSVHKTLPAPTQTALLHRNGDLTDGEEVRKYLRIYQSSSPSYILMAGIDEAVSLARRDGFQRLGCILELREYLVKGTKENAYIHICPVTEPGKLVIFSTDTFMTGIRLQEILRSRYHLEMEMAAGNYVVAILTMMDREEGLIRLLRALKEIDREILQYREEKESSEDDPEGFKRRLQGLADQLIRPETDLDLWEAYIHPGREEELEDAEGETAAEFINLYPPGIPLLVPGERVDRQMIRLLQAYLKGGYAVQGISEGRIKVVKSRKSE